MFIVIYGEFSIIKAGENVFGYINIAKDDLTVREYHLFRAYYCGLCKELGHQFNNRVKMGLNYDMVFLALLLDSLTDTTPKAEPIFCIVHPVQRRSALVQGTPLEYAAFMSILLTKSKIDDDKTDDGINLKNQIGSMVLAPCFFQVVSLSVVSAKTTRLAQKTLAKRSVYSTYVIFSFD